MPLSFINNIIRIRQACKSHICTSNQYYFDIIQFQSMLALALSLSFVLFKFAPYKKVSENYSQH